MPYSLFYFSDVKQDVKEAKTWYKEQQDGLEKRFADSIKTAISKLQKNPFAYAVRYKNIRIAHPKIFPYGIHFYTDETKKQIVIIAIVHNKRHPDIAEKRI
jgi:plasmid stabilization system protein ParE